MTVPSPQNLRNFIPLNIFFSICKQEIDSLTRNTKKRVTLCGIFLGSADPLETTTNTNRLYTPEPLFILK